jgi:hypothetical protein
MKCPKCARLAVWATDKLLLCQGCINETDECACPRAADDLAALDHYLSTPARSFSVGLDEQSDRAMKQPQSSENHQTPHSFRTTENSFADDVPRVLVCGGCGASFECAGSAECWCVGIQIQNQRLEGMKKQSKDCFCKNCLTD